MAHRAHGAAALTEKDLSRWRLVEAFQQRLAKAAATGTPLPPTWSDPQRLLQMADYLSLFLLGLLNPVVRTMRGLCRASHLERVQEDACHRPVSLGSFSEAQHLLNPELLEKVFVDLAAQVSAPSGPPSPLAQRRWLARDGTLWRALPRMHWALYGGGKAGYANRAVRLHLSLHLLDDKPVQGQVRPGKDCERAVWQEDWQTGDAFVGDRYFGENYRLLGQLEDKRCAYVLRLRDQATITVEEELPVNPADQAAGVVRQAWVRLGCRTRYQSGRVRVVWIQTPEHSLALVTHLDPEQLPAELVSLLYRKRWQIELFFRWIKCLLGCRHWLAESPEGVTIQVYLALIAALLLQLYTGQRPTRRMMELIQFYLLGVATLDELWTGLQEEKERLARQKIKKN